MLHRIAAVPMFKWRLFFAEFDLLDINAQAYTGEKTIEEVELEVVPFDRKKKTARVNEDCITNWLCLTQR